MANLVRTSIVIVALLAAFLSVPTTAARPCKTLFITFSIEPVRRPNPNHFIVVNPTDDRSAFTVFSSEELIRPDNNNGGLFLTDRPDFFPTLDFDNNRLHELEQPPSTFLGIDFDSLFDRSKDVLSVVVALLFGVGCGALTAATMYFAWMLVVGRREEDMEEYYSDYDEIPSPKKGGYVKIAAEAAPAQVKEVA